jgi:hypothetical protein
MNCRIVSVWIVVAVAGCTPSSAPAPVKSPAAPPASAAGASLELQREKAYPDLPPGQRIILVDFENSAAGKGYDQLRRFSFTPQEKSGQCRYVVNVTRTGAGALQASLAPGATLLLEVPSDADFISCGLLSMALRMPYIRDDLTVTLVGETTTWTAPRVLVKNGWNHVLVDVSRAGKGGDFDLRGVQFVGLSFPSASGDVAFTLDDVMLCPAERNITPSPRGMTVRRIGNDYELTRSSPSDIVGIAQSADGLWRVGELQPALQVVAENQPLPADEEEHIDALGPRRIAQVELIECNSARVRFGVAWYFPGRSGQLASMPARKTLWEYTFYSDGRCAIHAELNASGAKIGDKVRLAMPREAAWAGDGVRRGREITLAGPVGRWNLLDVPPSEAGKILLQNYLHPGRVKLVLGEVDHFAPGDADRDCFDESQGCYFLQARAGHCRFVLFPPQEGLLNPAFRIGGEFHSGARANVDGRILRDIAILEDGSAVFFIRGRFVRPIRVEVSGTSDSAR